MIITAKRLLTGVGTQSVALAGEMRDSPMDLSLDGGPLIDAADGYGWTEKRFFDRGNQEHALQFAGHVIHGNLVDAEYYVLNIENTISGNWDVYFTWAASSKILWMKNCVCLPGRRQTRGKRSIITWTIRGGRMRLPADNS